MCYSKSALELKKRKKEAFQRDICIPMFVTASLTIAKRWKQSKCLRADE